MGEKAPGGRPIGWGKTSTGGEANPEGGPGRRSIRGGITTAAVGPEVEEGFGSKVKTGGGKSFQKESPGAADPESELELLVRRRGRSGYPGDPALQGVRSGPDEDYSCE